MDELLVYSPAQPYREHSFMSDNELDDDEFDDTESMTTYSSVAPDHADLGLDVLDERDVASKPSAPVLSAETGCARPLVILPKRLNTGALCPGIGYGTGGEGRSTPDELYRALQVAINAGCRSFDSAPFYQDGSVERILGRAINDNSLPRSDFFVTTKVWPTFARNPEESLDLSLKNLNMEYVDCLLLHWPIPLRKVPDDPYAIGDTWDSAWDFMKTWEMMQKIPKGKARAIGVCNFTINRLRLLLASPTTTVVPAVLQVEGHPELPQKPLLRFCQEKGIQVFCFSPLAQGQVMNPTILRIARKHGVDSGRVAISWAVMRGTVPLPKSVNPARIRGNIELIRLDEDDIAELDMLGRVPRRIVNPRALFGHDIFENNADSYELDDFQSSYAHEDAETVAAIPRKRRQQ